MTDHDLELEPGMFTLDADDPRVVRGLLLPFGEPSRASITDPAGVMFSAGDIEIPTDPSIATLNREHERFDPVGRAVELVERVGVGILAAFRFAETPEGDAELAAYAAGRRRKLSAEIARYVDAAGNVVRRRLVGAALTDAGAFAGAGLYSLLDLDAGDLEGFRVVNDADLEAELEAARLRVAELEAELAPKPGSPAPVIAGEPTPLEPPAVPPAAGDSSINDDIPAAHAAGMPTEPATAELDDTAEAAGSPNGDNVGDATAPATLGTGAPAGDDDGKLKLDKAGLFAAIVDAKQTGAPIPAEYRIGTELFALGAATGNLGTVMAPQFIGQVWEGGDYVQKWLPLFAHGDLTSLSVTGWRSVSRPTVAAYAGDGAAVTGTAFTTETVTGPAQRFAGGNTLPREYYDFHAAEFVDAWGRFSTNDYKRKADGYVRTKALAAATPVTSVVPAGGEPSLPVIRRIVDGIFAIAADPINARASFAMIPDEDYKLLLHTGHSDLLEYLRLALNVEDGSVLGFHLGWDSTLAAGSVVVGAKESAKVRELPGSPIRINAANVAAGSFDEALFGYVHFLDELPEALVVVDDTP